MSQSQQLNFDDPWPIYDDEDEPWKDLERLLKLEDKMDTQKEIGAALGCTPSTISYWLDKARDEVEPEYDDEALQCKHFEVCGNVMDHPNSRICMVCLDLARHNTRRQLIDPADSETMTDHFEKLHEVYPEQKEERQAAYNEYRSEDDEDSEDES